MILLGDLCRRNIQKTFLGTASTAGLIRLGESFAESHPRVRSWSFSNEVSCPYASLMANSSSRDRIVSPSTSFGGLSLATLVFYCCCSCSWVEHCSSSIAFLLRSSTVARLVSFSTRMYRRTVIVSFPEEPSSSGEMRRGSSECCLWALSSLKQIECEVIRWY